jgi:DNA-binding NtrC family response regulator
MEYTPTSDSPKTTILVVDDDPATLQLVCKLLESDYVVLRANNAKEGLQQSKDCKNEIYLLLSDFEMPIMSGIALAVEITRQRPNLKVLLMSGYDEEMLVLNDGWHFLAKPFVPSQLRTLIRSLISPDLKSRQIT